MNAILEVPPDAVSRTDRVFRERLAGDDLRDLVPDAKVILDCGAGQGFFAKSARQVWPNAHIVSFEPASRFNLSLQPMDDKHEIHRIAVGAFDGQRKFYATHGPESNSCLEFLPNSPLCKIHRVVGQEAVECQRLDSVDWDACDILKLDVQGLELEVLEGAAELLKKHKPVIYTEVSFQPLYQDHPLIEDVDAFLADRGYRRLYLYASPMPDIWGDAIYVPMDVEVAPPIRLNIGAGDTMIPGFTPIDRKFGTEAFPLQYADNSVEEIRCVHMLEHLSFREVQDALAEWNRVIRPGGRLRLSVPDIHKCVKASETDDLWRFYIMGGQTDADDFHKSVWDERHLEGFLENAGFSDIKRWSSQNTDCSAMEISLNLEGIKPIAAEPETEACPTVKVRAVIGMPRIGWNDSWMTIVDAFKPFGIPIETHQGCFWGQNIQKAFNRAVKDGIDWIITLDYDSLIMPVHVSRLMEILGTHPEIDAIAALQMRRGAETPLFSTGGNVADIDWSPLKVNTAHFGLTILRVECLKDIPKPWLIDVPNADGDFDGDYTDADITFWKKWTAAGHTVYVAPDVRIGHLELLVSEFDEELKARHFHIGEWWNRHAKAGHCMRTKKED
jgi:FkbM family methyltransferase